MRALRDCFRCEIPTPLEELQGSAGYCSTCMDELKAQRLAENSPVKPPQAFPGMFYRRGMEMIRDRARVDRLFTAIAWAALVIDERRGHAEEMKDAQRDMREALAEAKHEASERWSER